MISIITILLKKNAIIVLLFNFIINKVSTFPISQHDQHPSTFTTILNQRSPFTNTYHLANTTSLLKNKRKYTQTKPSPSSPLKIENIYKRNIRINNNIKTEHFVTNQKLLNNKEVLNPPFIVDFNCEAPELLIKRNLLFQNQTESYCSGAVEAIQRGLSRITNVVYFKHTVRVNIHMYSYCKFDNPNNFNPNNCSLSALAAAEPASYYIFDRTFASQNALDAGYMYPASLAKQYAPEAFQPDQYDVNIDINSDQKWVFGIPKFDVFDFKTKKSSPGNVYDFEQIFLHELLHGLGFVSNWYTWYDELYLPGWVNRDEFNTILSISSPSIFDRFISDQVTKTWMSEYANSIIKDSISLSLKLNTTNENEWFTQFSKTTAGTLSKLLLKTVATTPFAQVMWFPSKGPITPTQPYVQTSVYKQQTNMRPVVMYSPRKYEPGSSGSHVENGAYEGTPDFLMRPYGTMGVSLDDYVPMGRVGPIGEAVLGVLRGMGYVTALGPL